MARRIGVFVVAWICFSFVSVAQTPTTPPTTTPPSIVAAPAFPVLTGRVVDEAELLSMADRAALTASLADLEAKTTAQLVVVTLKSLQGATIEEYGYQLGRHWKIGQKDRDSGVLLIVAIAERKVRIEVGYGLEGILTDAATKLIIENSIVPRFRTGDFAGGIKSGVADIIKLLGGDAEGAKAGPTQTSALDNRPPVNNAKVWQAIVLGLIGLALVVVCTLTSGRGVCRAVLQILFILALSGRGNSSRDRRSFSGGGGSFGGGGSSGSW